MRELRCGAFQWRLAENFRQITSCVCRAEDGVMGEAREGPLIRGGKLADVQTV
jgi:hypothetical protein